MEITQTRFGGTMGLTEQLPMMEMASSIIIGTRNYQQDALWHTISAQRHEVFAIICDGMGGLSGGERASQTAVSVLGQLYESSSPVQDIPAFLRQAAVTANQSVDALKDSSGKPLRAGSTLIGVFIRENQLYWVSVGDSRLYFMRDCEIYPCCREHNYETLLQEKYQRGEITAEDIAKDTKRRDALTSYLGMPKLAELEVNQAPMLLEPGDMLVLCSDGLYKSVPNDIICRIAIENKLDLQTAADKLTAEALARAKKGQDNTTVIALRYNGDWFGDGYYG